MKRALLFICASIAGFNSFAVTDTLHNGFRRTQLDTATTILITFPPGANGTVAGVNDQLRTSFAQVYTTFNNPYGWTVTGAISTWIGNVSSTSGNSVTIKVWKVDSSDAVKNDVNGRDSVTGFPGTMLGSTTLAFNSMNINATAPTPPAIPLHAVSTFSPGINVNRPFFVGYSFNGGYSWATKGSENVALATTPQAAGGAYFVLDRQRQNYYAHISPATPTNDTCFLSVNAYFDATPGINKWQDYYWKDGTLFSLDIVPIVDSWSDNVEGLTRNNLTFFGNYPNPAVNSTSIKFALAKSSDVSIEIIDMSGRTINTINKGNVGAGEHVIPVSTAELAAGTYLYIIKAGADAFASHMSVIK